MSTRPAKRPIVEVAGTAEQDPLDELRMVFANECPKSVLQAMRAHPCGNEGEAVWDRKHLGLLIPKDDRNYVGLLGPQFRNVMQKLIAPGIVRSFLDGENHRDDGAGGFSTDLAPFHVRLVMKIGAHVELVSSRPHFMQRTDDIVWGHTDFIIRTKDDKDRMLKTIAAPATIDSIERGVCNAVGGPLIFMLLSHRELLAAWMDGKTMDVDNPALVLTINTCVHYGDWIYGPPKLAPLEATPQLIHHKHVGQRRRRVCW